MEFLTKFTFRTPTAKIKFEFLRYIRQTDTLTSHLRKKINRKFMTYST